MQPGSEAFSQAELEAWSAQIQAIGEEYKALLEDLIPRMVPDDAAQSVHAHMREAFQAGAESLMQDPTLLWETQARLVQDQFQLWQNGMRALAGEAVEPLITPARGIAASRTRPGPATRTISPSCSSTCCSRAGSRS